LYETTGGSTPRNTSSLITFGEPVKIAGLSASQIIQTLKPLDIIVWMGHVIIVLDKERTIESRLDYDKEHEGNQGGVRIRTLKEVVDETRKERVPVDNYEDEVEKGKKKFVVRRWYSSMKN
ncbi:MAG: peptidoglycan endopeptidase, partial [Deltaproteobacteria bacterium]|nr:peptidoglycan endopeptidase [Deltaproteobacteria bacterium]